MALDGDAASVVYAWSALVLGHGGFNIRVERGEIIDWAGAVGGL